jgi:hypothetical protein
VLNPNEPIQKITFSETIHVSVPMLVQAAEDVVCDPDVQRRAVLVRENADPIAVVTHATENQRCLKAWPYASHFVAALRST